MSLAQFKDQALKAWNGWSQTQRVALLTIAVIAVSVLAGLGVWSQTPDYATAFSNLSQEDAGAIVEQLKSAGTIYQLADGGTTIKVPAALVYETRISLARQGLPQSGTVGFELFSQSNFGMTDFAQKINYQRAIEGELARSVASLGPVESARVHLAIPEPSVFTNNRQETTASVLIKVKPGRTLDASQVQGIRYLVSKSVEGLNAANVVVMDTSGALLAGGDGTVAGGLSGSASSSDQVTAQRAYERGIETKVSDMLRLVLGPNKATVQASADLDWTTEEISSELYTPGQAQGVVRSSQDLVERSVISGTSSGGVPGTQSNFSTVPSYQVSGGGTTTGYEKRDTVINYEVNKTVNRSVKAPGRVKRLSLAVLVEDTVGDEQVASIRQAASAAAGIDTQRGDTVYVSSMPFDRTYLAEEKKALEEAAQREQNVTIGTGVGLAVAFLVLLFFVWRLFRSLAGPSDAPRRAAMLEAAMGPALAGPKGSSDRPRNIALLAESNPQVAAGIVESWLAEGAVKDREEPQWKP
jgi:flagellar M-ring protein FliF